MDCLYTVCEAQNCSGFEKDCVNSAWLMLLRADGEILRNKGRGRTYRLLQRVSIIQTRLLPSKHVACWLYIVFIPYKPKYCSQGNERERKILSLPSGWLFRNCGSVFTV